MGAAALSAAAAAGAGQTSKLVWGGLALGAVAAAFAAWKLGQTRQKFIFTDYVQADH